jgi:hypothetical protein
MPKKSIAHWCWPSGIRKRIRRVGSSLECVDCRRFAGKHKCGAVQDGAQAWKDYPVTDCASCTVIPGKIAEGPLEGLHEPTPVELAKDPFEPVPTAAESFGENIRAKSAKRKQAERRRMIILLILAANPGVMRIREIAKVLADQFDLVLDRKEIYSILEYLQADRFVAVEQVATVPAKARHAKTEGHYTLNLQLRRRLFD